MSTADDARTLADKILNGDTPIELDAQRDTLLQNIQSNHQQSYIAAMSVRLNPNSAEAQAKLLGHQRAIDGLETLLRGVERRIKDQKKTEKKQTDDEEKTPTMLPSARARTRASARATSDTLPDEVGETIPGLG